MMRAWVALIVGALLPRLAVADGVFLPTILGSGTATVSSDAQKALILWRDGQETLHVKTNYRGPASEFAWVIPVPSQPTVAKSDWKLYEQVERATRPSVSIVEYGSKGCCGCTPILDITTLSDADAAVTVLDGLDIEELHVDVVRAKEGAGFIDWLQKRKYRVDDAAQSALQAYIDKDFFFVVAKVRPEAPLHGDRLTGGPTPLAITFPTAKPFFPLAISAVGAAAENELLLLLVTPTWHVPADYPWTPLFATDIKHSMKQQERARLIQSKDGRLEFDVTPALRWARWRMNTSCLVLEAVSPGYWTYAAGILAERKPATPAQGVELQRYHAVLSPEGMCDITFRPASRHDRFPDPFRHEGKFEITCSRSPMPRVAVSALGIGLVAALLSWRAGRCSGLLRAVAAFGLLAGLAIGV